jgi:hypothetical protein
MNQTKPKHIDAVEFEITDPARQNTKPERATVYEPCCCGCDTRDGKHTGWAGYVRASNGKRGVSVWFKDENHHKEAIKEVERIRKAWRKQ